MDIILYVVVVYLFVCICNVYHYVSLCIFVVWYSYIFCVFNILYINCILVVYIAILVHMWKIWLCSIQIEKLNWIQIAPTLIHFFIPITSSDSSLKSHLNERELWETLKPFGEAGGRLRKMRCPIKNNRRLNMIVYLLTFL